MKDAITPPAGPDALAGIVASQIADKPPVHPQLDNLIRESAAPAEAEEFNPSIHELDPKTNLPALTSDGKYRRKRGRRPGQTYNAAGEPTGPLGVDDFDPDGNGPANPEPVCTAAQAKREARVLSGVGFGLHRGFGPKFDPTPQEAEEIEKHLAELIKENNGLGLPVWLELVGAYLQYLFPRLPVHRWLSNILPPGLIGPADAAPPAPAPEVIGADDYREWDGKSEAVADPPAPAPRRISRELSAGEPRTETSGGAGFAFGG